MNNSKVRKEIMDSKERIQTIVDSGQERFTKWEIPNIQGFEPKDFIEFSDSIDYRLYNLPAPSINLVENWEGASWDTAKTINIRNHVKQHKIDERTQEPTAHQSPKIFWKHQPNVKRGHFLETFFIPPTPYM
ncbi:unnamed protein product [Dovyalis caffra]|uniref:Uncharacterized protein n=1 Tax=Dovyalis caffra TaxID=77055 RepID=A0AAV1R099_9ROSI|nr:unnamed protein product [Dovyalis caffra]